MQLEVVPREILIAVVALALLGWLASVLPTWTKRSRHRQRMVRAAEGEREAVTILEEHGYVVEAAQVSSSYAIDVDGQRVRVALRVDYVVRRGGARFVAEVKTGDAAPRVGTTATRRQLLEYSVAFGGAGILLVDADTRRIHRVVFPSPPSQSRSSRVVWALAFVSLAFGVFVLVR